MGMGMGQSMSPIMNRGFSKENVFNTRTCGACV